MTFHGYDASSCLRDPAYVEALHGLFKHAQGTWRSAIRYAQGSFELAYPLTACRRTTLEYRRTIFVLGSQGNIFKAVNGERINLLQVGRFIEKKGHEYTLRAFAVFSRHYPNSVLTLVGDGPLLQHCQALSSALGLGSRIVFTGPKGRQKYGRCCSPRMLRLHHSITASDGDQEGIPISIMEAMSTGLPV